MFSQDRLHDLIAQSLTIRERLKFIDDLKFEACSHADDYLKRIHSNSDSLQPQFLAHYFNVLGIDADKDLRILSIPSWKDGARLPKWSHNLMDILPLFGKSTFPNNMTLRFSGLYSGLMEWCRTILEQEPLFVQWEKEALDILAKGVVKRVGYLFEPSLSDWFSHYERVKSPIYDHIPERSRGEILNKKFITWLQNGQIFRFFEQKPVLIRALGMVILQWRETVCEMAKRLLADQEKLGKFLGRDALELPVLSVKWPLSDFHGNGRAVAILTLCDGMRLVYKPKPVKSDLVLEELISHYSQKGTPLPVKIPPALDMGDYGWSLYIYPDPVGIHKKDKKLAGKYGELLAFAHALGVTDLHWENIVIENGLPVIVDSETFLRPRYAAGQSGKGLHGAWRKALENYEDTIFGVGLFPDGVDPEAKFDLPEGIDEQDLKQVLKGFQKRYKHLMENRNSMINFLTAKFKDVVIRQVFKQTADYYNFLNASIQPWNLISGAIFSMESALVCQDLSTLESFDVWVGLCDHFSLERFDIPAYKVAAKGGVLFESGSADFPMEPGKEDMVSGIQKAVNKLNGLGLEDCEDQQQNIEFIFSKKKPTPQVPEPYKDDPYTFDDEFIKQAVREITSQLLELAFKKNGGAVWTGVEPSTANNIIKLCPLRHALYNGSSGIALSLGASYVILRDESIKTLALEAVAPLCHDLNQPQEKFALQGYGIGAGEGMDSMVYSLSLLSQLLGEPQLIDEALTLAHLIPVELIENDTIYDVIGGSAGLILSLGRLYRQTKENFLLDLIKAAAKKLLQHEVPLKWENKKSPWAGYSHGAAGFSLALTQAEQLIKTDKYTAAASKWRDYERQLQHKSSGNFYDARHETPGDPDIKKFMCAWCHGSAGIGLARLLENKIHADELSKKDIELSIQATIAHPKESLNHLCCGNTGRLEFIFSAGLGLKKEEYVSLARTRLMEILKENSDGFYWHYGRHEDNLGLFSGLSGILYTACRFLEPGKIPSILNFD
ncbi:MAG: type 2 lantipeptide synthetase LanM [Desulfobacteraceae bacterium]|nr:type 2 lantipeptide synthetase LanM [Desulfobacteraceae bacterium]